jgi:hypothetical protein
MSDGEAAPSSRDTRARAIAARVATTTRDVTTEAQGRAIQEEKRVWTTGVTPSRLATDGMLSLGIKANYILWYREK